MRVFSLILLIIWELVLMALYLWGETEDRGTILFLMTYFIIPTIYIALEWILKGFKRKVI